MTGCERVKHILVYIEDADLADRHEHGAIELGLVLSGSVLMKHQESEYTVAAGKLLLLNAYTPYRISCASGEPTRVLYIRINAAFCQEYLARLTNISFSEKAVFDLPEDCVDPIRQRILAVAMSYFQKSAAYQLDCMGQASLLMAQLLRAVPYRKLTDAEVMAQKSNLSRAQRITSYIEQHYRQKLTLSDLAEEEGVSAAYMSHAFRQLMHMPFQQYLTRLRLGKALPLLQDPSVHLVDVCLECGFSDTKYLNTVCQKLLGCSAQEYRNGSRNQEIPALISPLPEHKYSDRDCLAMLQHFRQQTAV